MFIKFLGNIHYLDEYKSTVKASSNCIHLLKETGYFSMQFEDEQIRDIIIKEIWDNRKKGEDFFDVDEFLNIYYEARK